MSQTPRDLVIEELNHVVTEILTHFSGADINLTSLTPEEAEAELDRFWDDPESLSSLIDLTGDTIHFGGALVATAETVTQLGSLCCPIDWLGEIMNMVMGGLKNRIAEYGIESELGLPEACRGISAAMFEPSEVHESILIGTEAGDLLAIFDFHIEPGGEWKEIGEEASLPPGEVCLF